MSVRKGSAKGILVQEFSASFAAARRTRAQVLGVVLCGVFLFLAAGLSSDVEAAPARSSNARRVYRWVDTDGKVRYSDRIPPDQVDLGRTELAPMSGMVQREIPRAKTAEQLAREAAEEQERRRQELLERAQKEEERRLLRRYRDIDAIDRDMNTQVERVDAEIKTIEARIATIRTSITDLRKRAADLERKQSTPPLDLYSRMDSLEKEVVEQEAIIVLKQGERREVEAQFADFREQFAKIMGLSSSGTTP